MNKILLLGHARHGKDTVADMLYKLYGLKSAASSALANRIFIFDLLKEKYGYATQEECFRDRVNHRAEWYDLIVEYNRFDRARLAKEILKEVDIYTGLRSSVELQECNHQEIFKYIIGVYDPRKPLEPTDSFNIDIWSECDFVINNGSSITDLKGRVALLRPLFETD